MLRSTKKSWNEQTEKIYYRADVQQFLKWGLSFLKHEQQTDVQNGCID